jgi:hypothetical protein
MLSAVSKLGPMETRKQNRCWCFTHKTIVRKNGVFFIKGEKEMNTVSSRIRGLLRRTLFASCCLVFHAASVFPQCDPADNGYVYLHPSFANRNWIKAAYDSVTIIIWSEAMCASTKPVQYDICGPRESAVAVFTTATNDLYLMNTQYECYDPKQSCTSCYLDYFDPAKITLAGITLAQSTPLYLIKDPAFGVDSVKVLVKNSQNKILAIAVSTAGLTVLHTDTLAMSVLQAGQNVVRIMGAYDSTAQKDTAVWLLGSNGLMRRFHVNGGQWAETNLDLGTGITDTVYCVRGMYAGTSTGSIYKKLGARFLFDSQPAASAILNIYDRGAVGAKGLVLDFNGTTWRDTTFGTAAYSYGNFINRWDGYGVELLDNQWRRTAVTYRVNPSAITATSPGNVMPFVNGMPYLFNLTPPKMTDSVTVNVKDPDSSYTDLSIILKSGGQDINMKNDGKYTITVLPADSQCIIDALRLKSGSIQLFVTSTFIRVSASCEIGKSDLSCPAFKCMRVDYPFVSTHTWGPMDTLTLSAGPDKLRIMYNDGTPINTIGSGMAIIGSCSVTPSLAGHHLTFIVRQGTEKKLTRIGLYNVSGQKLAMLDVGNRQSITAPRIASAGIVYARYLFSDGSTSCRCIPLIR